MADSKADKQSTNLTAESLHDSRVKQMITRLAEIRQGSSSIIKKKENNYELLMMLCRRQNQSNWLKNHRVDSVSLNLFGEDYYVKRDITGSPDDWMLWLVDKQLIPVQDSGTIADWRASLPLYSTGFDWSGLDNMSLPYISLSEHPEIIDHLLHLPHLVDFAGKPIRTITEPQKLNIRFEQKADIVTGTINISNQILWIDDRLILDNDMLYPAPLSKSELDMVRECASEFHIAIASEVLSLLFSITGKDNVNIEWEGKNIVYSDIPVKSINTLLFRSVDENLSLTINVTRTIADFSPDLCYAFHFSRYAYIRDNDIVVRQVSTEGLEDPAQMLDDRINISSRTRKMAKSLYRDGSVFILPKDLAEHFLYKELPWLLINYKVLGSEKLKAYKLTTSRPRINCTLTSGIDFLEGEASVEIEEERFTLVDILNQFRKNKYITLSDGNRVIVEDKYIKRLQRIFRTSKSKKDSSVKVSLFDMFELEDLLNEPLKGEAFDKNREIFDGLTRINEGTISVRGLKGKLRPYQEHGVKWLKYLYYNRLGGCLADDMGLGKTIQTIALLTQIYPATKSPTLIIMPRSLIFNWQEEFAKFAPKLKVSQYYGTGRSIEKAMKAQIVLTTYAIVRNDIEQLKDKKFHLIVLDESQNIKNQSAQSTQAVWLLKASHRLAISGTPIENNLEELYSLFRFLNPTMFGTLESFRENYTIPIQKEEDKVAAESLRRKIYPFVLRRLKQDVLTDLPDRTDQTIYVEMNPEQANFYERRRLYYNELINGSIKESGIGGTQMLLLQAMGELRRIASTPEALTDGRVKSAKLDTLLENLTSALTNGHKVIVFFNFLAGIELVSDFLTSHGVIHETMTGATSDRGKVVEHFQNDPDCKVMLMTLKTGGVGLNLTAADTVFIFEPWWNKAAEEQGINRLHRIGQKANVTCYSMIVKDSIEEKIRQLQEMKASLVDDIISTDSAGFKNLTAEDIEFIFK